MSSVNVKFTFWKHSSEYNYKIVNILSFRNRSGPSKKGLHRDKHSPLRSVNQMKTSSNTDSLAQRKAKKLLTGNTGKTG